MVFKNTCSILDKALNSIKKNTQTMSLSIAFILLALFLILLQIFSLLTPVLWSIIILPFIIITILIVYYNRTNSYGLFIVFTFHVVLRLLMLIKSRYFFYNQDEMYHLGLAIHYGKYPQLRPVGRMIGYATFPIMDKISGYLIAKFDLSNAVLIIGFVYYLLIPVLSLLIIDRFYRFFNSGMNNHLIVLLFAFNYKFLYFSSSYIYEALTFLIYVFVYFCIFKFQSNYFLSSSKNNNSTVFIGKKYGLVVYILAIWLTLMLMGLWHYNGLFFGPILIAQFIVLPIAFSRKQQNFFHPINDKSQLMLMAGLVPASMFFLNLYVLFSFEARVFANTYFISLIPSPIFSTLTNQFPFLQDRGSIRAIIFYQISGIFLYASVFVLIFLTIGKIQRYAASKNVLSRLTGKIIFIVFLLLGVFSIFLYSYFGSVFGFRTISNFSIFTIVSIIGFILIYLIALVSLVTLDDPRLLAIATHLLIIFSVMILAFFYPLGTHTTLAFRLIPYSYLNAVILAYLFLQQHGITIIRRARQLNFQGESKGVNRTIRTKKLTSKSKQYTNHLGISGNAVLLLIIIFSGFQVGFFATWEMYTGNYNLPEEDILLMSEWVRSNIPQNEPIFVEFIYYPILAFSLHKISNSIINESIILTALYYERNISIVIQLLNSTNTKYLIFDLAGNASGLNTRIGREHYLQSKGVSIKTFETYNDTIPKEMDIIYQTKYLVLLKIV